MALIMVVDDEDVLLEMVATLIDELGHESVVATNGREALDSLLIASEAPALIISDVMMPRMSGVELARAVKAKPRLAGVPIILMSAAGRPQDVQVADYFLHKPFDLDTLADLIDQYLVENSDRP